METVAEPNAASPSAAPTTASGAGSRTARARRRTDDHRRRAAWACTWCGSCSTRTSRRTASRSRRSRSSPGRTRRRSPPERSDGDGAADHPRRAQAHARTRADVMRARRSAPPSRRSTCRAGARTTSSPSPRASTATRSSTAWALATTRDTGDAGRAWQLRDLRAPHHVWQALQPHRGAQEGRLPHRADRRRLVRLPRDGATRSCGQRDGRGHRAGPQPPGAAPDDHYITLTTCHPMFSAAERFVVHGELEYWSPVGNGVPAELLEVPQS